MNKCQITERAKSAAGVKKDSELAQLIGISAADFSNRKKRGTHESLIIEWAAREGYDVGFIISGEGEKQASKVAPVDMVLVKQIIEAAMEHLQTNNLEMAPDKFAELIEVLYEEISESGAEQVNKGTVARLIKLAM